MMRGLCVGRRGDEAWTRGLQEEEHALNLFPATRGKCLYTTNLSAGIIGRHLQLDLQRRAVLRKRYTGATQRYYLLILSRSTWSSGYSCWTPSRQDLGGGPFL
jgi:hypothetical protein